MKVILNLLSAMRLPVIRRGRGEIANLAYEGDLTAGRISWDTALSVPV